MNIFFSYHLGPNCDITQISASHGDHTFDKYVLPTKPITKEASEATGLTCRDGQLLHHGQAVPAVTAFQALDFFLDFLEALDGPCILVGHNSKNFDSKVLLNNVHEYKLCPRLKLTCHGFSDSLTLFKEKYPSRKSEKKSYKQTDLCSDLLSHTYEAHNAMADVKALQKLCSLATKSEVLKSSFSIELVISSLKYAKCKKINAPSFQGMVSEKVISSNMVQKMAGSGLKMSHLQLAYARDPDRGIKNIFTETVQGAARVTKNNKIIENVNTFFAKLSANKDK